MILVELGCDWEPFVVKKILLQYLKGTSVRFCSKSTHFPKHSTFFGYSRAVPIYGARALSLSTY